LDGKNIFNRKEGSGNSSPKLKTSGFPCRIFYDDRTCERRLIPIARTASKRRLYPKTLRIFWVIIGSDFNKTKRLSPEQETAPD
jgi:hypothetical protein